MPKEFFLTDEGTQRELIPEDTYLAVCSMVCDLGTQKVEWAGEVKFQRKIWLEFELVEHEITNEEGETRRAVLGREFTQSLNERSNLRSFLVGWRGREFTDEEAHQFSTNNILGAPCMLQVIHKERKSGKGSYELLNAAGKLHKSMEKPTPNRSVCYFVDPENPHDADLVKVPEFLRKKIFESQEWIEAHGAGFTGDEGLSSEEVTDDEVPF